MNRKILISLVMVGIPILVSAQSTYQQVYNLVQANCTNSCHNSSNLSGNLDLARSESEVYSSLVNVAPSNAYASNVLQQKLVDPGYPERSFFLRKCNNGFDLELALIDASEGDPMPASGNPLEDYEIELIRQWILWGAHDTGSFVSPQLLQDYYENGGVSDIAKPPTPEEEGLEGYQVRFGPFFMNPGEEFEFVQSHKILDDIPKEIYRLKSIMHPYSHHWALRSLEPGLEESFGPGPVSAYSNTVQQQINQHGTFMGIWSYSRESYMPNGTAIYQDSAEVLLLNLHIANYSQDSICKASVYQNIYTTDSGSGSVPISARTAQYGGNNPETLQIPSDGQVHTFEFSVIDPGETYHLWALQAHTHSRGVDFDVFLRNPDGTKGEQVYEGFYDTEYDFNTGFYDFTHPPVRTWPNLFEVNMDWGLIVEGKFINTTGEDIGFGLTTDDEMHTLYYLFTQENPNISGLRTKNTSLEILKVYPNPSDSYVTFSRYDNQEFSNAQVSVFNSLGNLVFFQNDISGKSFELDNNELGPGTYHFAIKQSTENPIHGNIVFIR